MAQQQRAARGQQPLDYMLNRFIRTFFAVSVLCRSLKHELACRLARRTKRPALMLRSTTRRCLRRPAVKSRQEHAGVRLLRLSKLSESSRLAAFSMVFCSRCLIFLFYVMCHVLLSDACAFCRLVRRRKERQPCQPLILLSVKSSSAMFSHTT